MDPQGRNEPIIDNLNSYSLTEAPNKTIWYFHKEPMLDVKLGGLNFLSSNLIFPGAEVNLQRKMESEK